MKSRSGGHTSRPLIFMAVLQIQMFIVMPIVIMPDGWIHDFKTRSVIGKLPSIVSIPVYSSIFFYFVVRLRETKSQRNKSMHHSE